MGAIAECQAAGIPDALIIPIRPWDKPDDKGNGAGKAPALPNGQGGWEPLTNWQYGEIHPNILAQADLYGANAGLLLGAPSGEWHFGAVDIDLDPGQEVHRDRLLTTLTHATRGLVMVRNTVPYRALVLVRISDLMSHGRKLTYNLQFTDPTVPGATTQDIGKIELLTTGQQCVIAGMHPSGNTIQWHEASAPDQTALAPMLHENMMCGEKFEDVSEFVRSVLDSLVPMGYYYEAKFGGGTGSALGADDLAPPWLDISILCDLINATPNGADVDRDAYVGFMLASAASMRGIEARRGILSADEKDRVRHAAVSWAAKWVDQNSNKSRDERYVEELAKWDSDWCVRSEYRTNWYRLCAIAQGLGVVGACAVNAQFDFAASVVLENAAEAASVSIEDMPMASPRPNEIILNVENSMFSDFSVIDFTRTHLKFDQMARYVPSLDRWLLWEGRRGWTSNMECESTVKFTVMQCLKQYVDRFGKGGSESEKWTNSQVSSMLSMNRTNKVMEGLGATLTIRDTEMNNSRYFLQTPNGTYDLRTLEPVGGLQRKLQFETRYTTVVPDLKWAPTPMFDDVIDHLSDGSPEVADWLWHYLGYSLLGHPRDDCFVVIWGSGSNGKTVLANVLKKMMGDYATELNAEVLTEGGKRLHQTSLNRLRFRRLALVSEMPKDDKWNERILKMISGGDDIEARDMFQSASSFRGESALLIMCNELPAFSRVNTAILRRFRMIGTTRQPAVIDPLLEDKILNEESPAVLGKLMHYACKVFNLDGEVHGRLPPVPEAMTTESDNILSASDPVFRWLRAECNFGPAHAGCEEQTNVLLNRFEAWRDRQRRVEAVNSMPGDKISESRFLESLRGVGISVRDNKGRKLQKMKRTGDGTIIEFNFVRGVELKVKEAA